MRLLRFVFSIYIGVLFSFVFAFFFGEAGIGNYNALSKHKESLEENIVGLKMINVKLNQELRLLRTNPQIIRILARDMGYFKNDEHVIKIDGFYNKKNYYEVGKLIQRAAGVIHIMVF